jgi:M6 family metalloprotease-like protein
MKPIYLRTTLSFLFFAIITLPLFAVGAYPWPVNMLQPDGSLISIQLSGDEFYHFQTTEDGYPVKKSAAGYFKYATIDSSGKFVESIFIAKNINRRTKREVEFLKTISKADEQVRIKQLSATRSTQMRVKSSVATMQKTFPTTGFSKSIIILVNFSDNNFSVSNPNAAFTDLLNQSGYIANGGTGSAKDYFLSASMGAFSPQFDVVGPYTLPHPLAYYGKNDVSGNDTLPRQMVIDACTLASQNGVKFSQYDADGDGRVDNVFIYYAGYNEAEHGDANTIWPHKWELKNYSTRFNGKIIYDYACTSELKGYSGTNMCGIGTFCHEFGHVLGLPDYYDTSGNNHATLGVWNIMSSGNYNNNGRTPPTYSCYDRFFLNWLTPQEVDSTSELTLLPTYQGTTPLGTTNQQSYLFSSATHNLNGSSPNPGEFFMVEYRKKTGWDTYLPAEGMLVWHIDYDQAAWDGNTPNNYTGSTQTAGSHMRVYIQPLSGSTATPGTAFSSGSFTPTTWVGTDINRAITNITRTTDNITFRLIVLPKVTTVSTSFITATSALSGGNVTSDGNTTVTARGVCWATTTSPTISNSKTTDASGIGTFSSSISGLTAGTLYYVRAYATNSGGTAYGNEVSFIYTNADKTITDFTNSSSFDIAVASGTRFTTNTSGQTLHSIVVQPGGTLDLANTITVTGDVVLKSDNNSSFNTNVGGGATVGGTLKYIKTMDDAHWYFLSFPCNVPISSIKKSDGSSLGVLGTDWFIQTYNGSTRAVNLGAVSNWNNILNTNLSLTAYTGYAIGLKTGVGTYDVLFLLQNSLLATESARSVPVIAYGAGTAVAPNNIGWNLVGQPYLSRYAASNAGVNYMTFPADATAQTYMTTDLTTTKVLDPFTAFFVQADTQLETSQISFATTGRRFNSAAFSPTASNKVQLNVTTVSGTDNTNLIIDSSMSAGYVIGQDIEKWIGIGTQKPQLYTILNNINYSYNALPESSLVNLPVGFYTQTAGQATISIDASIPNSLSGLYLTDKTTGVTTNLLTSGYSFEATAGTNTSRFVLNLIKVVDGISKTQFLKPAISLANGSLLIDQLLPGTNVRVYTPLGRLIENTTRGTSKMNIQLPGKGVYIVLVENLFGSGKYKVVNKK